jgi:hypothetical protein
MKIKKMRGLILFVLMMGMFLKAISATGFYPVVVSNNATFLQTPSTFTVADLNKDGNVDFIYDEGTRRTKWLENLGDNQYVDHLIQDTDLYYFLVVVDLDKDGYNDILAMDSFFNDSLWWWKNDGNQNFARNLVWNQSKSSYNPEDMFDVIDFEVDGEGDGDWDIVLCDNPAYGVNRILWLENDGSQNFAIHNASDTEGCYNFVDAVDFDQDGDTDIVYYWDGYFRWKENRGGIGGEITWSSHNIGSAYAPTTNGPVVVDYDDDGDLDFVEGDIDVDKIYVFVNNGFMAFSRRSIYSGGQHPAITRVADFNNDNHSDIAFTLNTDDEIYWMVNNGSQNYTTLHLIDGIKGGGRLDMFDMDGDGDLDLPYVDSSPEIIEWYKNVPDGQLEIINYTCTQVLVSDSFSYSDEYVNHGWTESISSPYDVPVDSFWTTNAFGIDNTTSGTVNTAWGDNIHRDTPNDIFTGTVIASMDYYIYFSNYTNDLNYMQIRSNTGKWLTFNFYRQYHQYRIANTADGGEDCYMDAVYEPPVSGELVIEIDLSNKKYSAYINGDSHGCYNIELGNFGGVRTVYLYELVKDTIGSPMTYDKHFDNVNVCKGSTAIGTACHNPDGYENQYYCLDDTVYECNGVEWDFFATCNETCAVNSTAYDTPSQLCSLPNQIPVISGVASFYYNGLGDIIYNNTIPITQNVYFRANAIDNEDDPLWISVDCDNSFGPPWVLAWGNEHSQTSPYWILYTDTACNYSTAGTYTAKVYVTDNQHNWSEPYGYLEFMYSEVTITDCSTHCVADYKYDCNNQLVEVCENQCADGECVECNTDLYCSYLHDDNWFCNDVHVCEQYGQCVDSDGGIDYLVQGTTANGSLTMSDFCDGHILNEFYCSGDSTVSKEKDCRQVGAGYDCNDGRCVYSACTDPSGFLGQYYCVGSTIYACNSTGWNLFSACNTTYGGVVCASAREGNVYNDEYLSSLCSDVADCNDSDSGVNYFVYGHTFEPSTGAIRYDTCVNTSHLEEQYCSGDYVSSIVGNCRDFGSQYSCSNGKCTAGNVVFANCTDSDGGLEYFVKGYVQDNNFPNQTFWDGCESVEEGSQYILWEQFCGDLGIDVIDKNCHIYGSNYICYDGACIQKPEHCADIDGVDYFEASYVLDSSETVDIYHYDFCTGDTLFEYVCQGETPATVAVDCTYYAGYPYCLNGRCSAGECSDSDGGIDYYTLGTVTQGDGDVEYTDYCSGGAGNNINEYYCENDSIKLDAYHYCESGCSGGVCVLLDPTNPASADTDSPWYRDANGTIKFNASKCEGWNSMILCAGTKYTIGKVASGTSWIFSGIHILYFIVLMIIIIIVGPLLVEFFKSRGK